MGRPIPLPRPRILPRCCRKPAPLLVSRRSHISRPAEFASGFLVGPDVSRTGPDIAIPRPNAGGICQLLLSRPFVPNRPDRAAVRGAPSLRTAAHCSSGSRPTPLIVGKPSRPPAPCIGVLVSPGSTARRVCPGLSWIAPDAEATLRLSWLPIHALLPDCGNRPRRSPPRQVDRPNRGKRRGSSRRRLSLARVCAKFPASLGPWRYSACRFLSPWPFCCSPPC